MDKMIEALEMELENVNLYVSYTGWDVKDGLMKLLAYAQALQKEERENAAALDELENCAGGIEIEAVA